MVRGANNTQIAGRLVISRRTAEWYVHRLFARTGAGSREELGEILADLLHLHRAERPSA